MFPEIEEKVLQFIKKQSRKNYLILDAAILFNSNLYKLCNYIMLLKLSAENRRKFLLKKTGFDLDEINRRISGQYIKIKRKLVDCTIQNNGTTMDLFKKVKNAAAEIAARNS